MSEYKRNTTAAEAYMRYLQVKYMYDSVRQVEQMH